MPGFMWDLGFWTGYSPPVSAGPCFPAQPLPKAHTHVFDYGALASRAASGTARSLQPPLAARTSFSRRCRGMAAPRAPTLKPLCLQEDVCPRCLCWAEAVKLMTVLSCSGLGMDWCCPPPALLPELGRAMGVPVPSPACCKVRLGQPQDPARCSQGAQCPQTGQNPCGVVGRVNSLGMTQPHTSPWPLPQLQRSAGVGKETPSLWGDAVVGNGTPY